ncbi:hypothetical protein N9N28_04690 [Rubripirellula amarantea]|nr:hypothetical protein [Rubripirellula amarantea]
MNYFGYPHLGRYSLAKASLGWVVTNDGDSEGSIADNSDPLSTMHSGFQQHDATDPTPFSFGDDTFVETQSSIDAESYSSMLGFGDISW